MLQCRPGHCFEPAARSRSPRAPIRSPVAPHLAGFIDTGQDHEQDRVCVRVKEQLLWNRAKGLNGLSNLIRDLGVGHGLLPASYLSMALERIETITRSPSDKKTD